MTLTEHRRYAEGEALAVDMACGDGLYPMVQDCLGYADIYAAQPAAERAFYAGWLDEAIWLVSLDAWRAVGGTRATKRHSRDARAAAAPENASPRAARKVQGKQP